MAISNITTAVNADTPMREGGRREREDGGGKEGERKKGRDIQREKNVAQKHRQCSKRGSYL